jgi:peptide methionine sulfoxide reductase msrA/msrB
MHEECEKKRIFVQATKTKQMKNMKEIYLAGGCFWGAEHFLKQINGVTYTEVGYANGNVPDPTYQQVYTDTTGYAETVHVEYDPEIISLKFLLRLYFKAIDPISLNKQGEDIGTRYRTGIYFTDLQDIPVIKEVYQEVADIYNAPLTVEFCPLKNFYPAEEYHQDYLDKNPTGYCHLNPELFKMARKAKMK